MTPFSYRSGLSTAATGRLYAYSERIFRDSQGNYLPAKLFPFSMNHPASEFINSLDHF
jgi:hypothetical protein